MSVSVSKLTIAPGIIPIYCIFGQTLCILKAISIITVNFNQPELTEMFLDSVKQFYSDQHLEIIVVDNGSRIDPTVNWSVKYPDVIFIRSGENLGFAGGNNIGIRASSGEYLFFVNNDTEFTPDLLEELTSVLENNGQVAAVSPKILYYDQKNLIQYAGFTSMNFNTGRNECIGKLEPDDGQYDKPAGITAYAHGAAMMVRREAIDKAGVMPENYFLYYEEMDWCEMFKRQGYQIWVAPLASIYHKESVSVGRDSPLKEYFMTRNRILFIRRNATAFSLFIFSMHLAFLVTPRNLIRYFKTGRFDLAKEFFKAIRWNITHSKTSKILGFNLKKI